MNKVIIINLNGVAYQLEDGGYEALREYLDTAARRLECNPDRGEIIADIEQAISDKFRGMLGDYKTVILTKEVASVVKEMGPVEDASGAAAASATDRADAKPTAGAQAAGEADDGLPPRRRLYRISDGAMLAGVCNGLSAHLNIDVSFVRVGFALLSIFWGTGLLVYVILAFILPEANTPAEKAAATGVAATAEEFIRRAKAGYYEGMKSFGDKQAHREWKRRFKREMRDWKHGFRRQMHEQAHQWSAQHPAHPVVPVVLTPIIRLLLLALAAVWVCGIYTLVTAGTVFGFTPPSGIPVWLAVVLMVIAFQIVAWPLRALRHGCYFHGPYGGLDYRRRHGPCGGLFGLALLVLCVWLADRNVPEFHSWLMNLPPAVHHVTDSLQAWWARQ